MVKSVPGLRFSEFKDDYNLYKLGEITSWNSGGTPSKVNPAFWNGDIPWISASAMHGSQFYDSKTKITELGLNNGSKLAKKGSILLLVRGSMLFKKIPVGIAVKDVAFNQDVKSINLKNISKALFLLHWFYAKENYILSKVLSTGIGAGKLDTEDLKELKIYLPSLPEQQKIAAFLSAVDKKIRLLGRKKVLLERYKKGVMQKLFSRELRFKDVDEREFADWEERKLGDYVIEMRGGASFKPDDFTTDEGYEVVPKKAIGPGGRLKFNTSIFCNSVFYKANPNNQINSSYLITTLRDLVPSGPNIGYIVSYNNKKTYILAQGVYAFKIKEEFLDENFLIHFSNTKTYRRVMQKIMVGSTQVHIRNTDYLNLQLSVPSIFEQNKISIFLSNNNKKINQVQNLFSIIQEFKKGLLQQMFI